jgi:hypothetical protein
VRGRAVEDARNEAPPLGFPRIVLLQRGVGRAARGGRLIGPGHGAP